ncbi:MAG: tautomerase family protein [Clostridiales Family XIII bacterium]|nr:tautomerase family protein [Clostridiales Family XIII bacterium]
MPLIQIKAYTGRDRETQIKASKAVMAAAAEAMGVPETAFTVIYEDFPKEEWQEKVADVEVAPREDKIVIKSGELVAE